MEAPAAPLPTIVAAFLRQVEICEQFGSPFYAELLRRCVSDLEAGGSLTAAVAGWRGDPRREALALRLLGAVHRMVLDGEEPLLASHYPTVGGMPYFPAAFEAFAAVVERRLPEVRARLQQVPQTNEIGRSAALFGAFLWLAAAGAGPLHLRELGASAGLNLLWDHYRYECGHFEWGPAGSPVVLRPTWRRLESPPVAACVEVASRAGCDLLPLDAGDPDHCRRLQSYVWADQVERLQTLQQAFEVARRQRPRVDRMHAVDWLRAELAAGPQDGTTVVYHSIVWNYLDDAAQQELTARMRAEGERRGPGQRLAWLRFEDGGQFATDVRVTLWPGGRERLLAQAQTHGQWVEWLGVPPG